MKRTYIAFGMEDGKFTPHDHPVFTGERAYDLGNEQDVQVDPDLDVREFTGHGEAIGALQDYFRECPKEERVEMTEFFLIEKYSGQPFITPAPKAKTKKDRSIGKPEKIKKSKSDEPKN